MRKKIKRAWGKAFNRRSLIAPNKQSIAEIHSRMVSFSEHAAAARAKHEQRLDKILRDTFGIERYNAAQPHTEPYLELDPWMKVQERLTKLAEEMANPKMLTICLASTTNIKVYLIWGHGGSLVAHQYYIHEYNSKMRRLRQSYQFNTRERAVEAWRFDRVLWENTLFLPNSN